MAEGSLPSLDVRDIDTRGIDFKNLLSKGETILNCDWSASPTGLIVRDDSSEIVGSTVSVVLEGQTLGEFVVTAEITTSVGRRLNRSFEIAVEDR